MGSLQKILSQLALLLLLSLLAGTNALAAPYTFEDGSGSQVAYQQDAKRVVCLAPNLTEILHYVGLGERQVGRTDFCDYPAAVAKLPSVGGFADTSLEGILALKPDLVLAYQGNSLELVSQLRRAGISVLALSEAKSLDEIALQMERVLGVAGNGSTNIPEINDWRTRLAALTSDSYPANLNAESFFFGYPGDTAYTCSSDTFVSDLIERAGLINSAGHTSEAWPQVSAEFILSARPDWIVTGTSCTADEDPEVKRRELLTELQAKAVWKSLPAVSRGQVAAVDADILLRPGPRVLDALEELQRQLTEFRKTPGRTASS